MTTDVDFEQVDWFRAGDLYQDPYPYYEWLRAHSPIFQEPRRGVYMVTGYDECVAIYNDTDNFSSANAVSGNFVPFPEPFVGDDVSDVIDRNRDVLIFSDQLPTFDPPKHTAHRGLLMRLITPKRMKENEEFMWRMADDQLDEVLPQGECEFLHDYAGPFTLLVVADLLGVPEEDHETFRRQLQGDERPSSKGEKGAPSHKPLEFLYDRFTTYIEDRRANPGTDVMTQLATATFPDGSLPEVHDIMLISANLFSAGGETTARMLGTALRILGERPDLQEQLRADRSRIAPFLEECVRLESPLQGSFRMARRRTTVGDVEIPAGATLFVMAGAANRDPRLHPHPDVLDLDRVNGRQHLGFGWGAHACVGAPLARAEGRASLERILDRMHDIRISEQFHADPDAPGGYRYHYEPIFLLRGLTELHLEFAPAG
ncbi:MAG: cytochrome P450 [Acidimicrobiia bacterium]